MAHGKDIRIYLSDGTVSGIRTAEIMNWTGRGMLVPRNKVEQVSEWSEELSGPSVYALFGTDEETGGRRAYIGYSDKFLNRIKDHLTKKDFWRDFVVFHNKDKYFNSAHARYLEARIWKLAKEAKRYILDNDVSPPDAELSRPEQDTMEDFLANIRLLLGVLGHRVLEPITPRNQLSNSPSDAQQNGDLPTYHLNVGAAQAQGFPTDEGFVVLEGSIAALKDGKSMTPSSVKRKSSLIDKGILQGQGDKLILTESHLFTSPSTAATIMCGYPQNGRRVWQTAGGKALKEVEEEALQPLDSLLETGNLD